MKIMVVHRVLIYEDHGSSQTALICEDHGSSQTALIYEDHG